MNNTLTLFILEKRLSNPAPRLVAWISTTWCNQVMQILFPKVATVHIIPMHALRTFYVNVCYLGGVLSGHYTCHGFTRDMGT